VSEYDKLGYTVRTAIMRLSALRLLVVLGQYEAARLVAGEVATSLARAADQDPSLADERGRAGAYVETLDRLIASQAFTSPFGEQAEEAIRLEQDIQNQINRLFTYLKRHG